MDDTDKLFEFFRIANDLKKTYRFSELPILKEKESSADHSWRLSLMAFMIADELQLKIDILKALKIAILHDIAEAITGDIDSRLVYEGNVSKKEKDDEEEKAIIGICNRLPQKQSQELLDFWKDYQLGTSPEARYIKALDKIETLDYMLMHGSEAIDVPDMIAFYADKPVANFPELRPILAKIKNRLKEVYAQGDIEWKKEYDEF